MLKEKSVFINYKYRQILNYKMILISFITLLQKNSQNYISKTGKYIETRLVYLLYYIITFHSNQNFHAISLQYT